MPGGVTGRETRGRETRGRETRGRGGKFPGEYIDKHAQVSSVVTKYTSITYVQCSRRRRRRRLAFAFSFTPGGHSMEGVYHLVFHVTGWFSTTVHTTVILKSVWAGRCYFCPIACRVAVFLVLDSFQEYSFLFLSSSSSLASAKRKHATKEADRPLRAHKRLFLVLLYACFSVGGVSLKKKTATGNRNEIYDITEILSFPERKTKSYLVPGSY